MIERTIFILRSGCILQYMSSTTYPSPKATRSMTTRTVPTFLLLRMMAPQLWPARSQPSKVGIRLPVSKWCRVMLAVPFATFHVSRERRPRVWIPELNALIIDLFLWSKVSWLYATPWFPCSVWRVGTRINARPLAANTIHLDLIGTSMLAYYCPCRNGKWTSIYPRHPEPQWTNFFDRSSFLLHEWVGWKDQFLHPGSQPLQIQPADVPNSYLLKRRARNRIWKLSGTTSIKLTRNIFQRVMFYLKE